MLYFKVIPNSIDFYKKIFLHVIPACIAVPWENLNNHLNSLKFNIIDNSNIGKEWQQVWRLTITLIEEEKVVSEDQESTETFKSYFAGLIPENKGM